MAPISERISSHRAAQAAIYADQIISAGYDVTVNFGGKIEDYNDFDILAVYHGNDWGGTVNMFGGVKAYGAIDQIVRLSRFNGTVWSLAIDFPGYTEMIKPRVDKEPASHPDWQLVDWDNLRRIEKTAVTKDPNDFVDTRKIVIGDSHAISMYRPGWKMNSVPFKTLHGALSMGLSSFVPAGQKFDTVEFYFGNIDIRHHLMRQPNPVQATKDLVKEYVKQAWPIAPLVRIYEPLPIENESRKLPKTGYYKGTPFYGSWNERNNIRHVFIEELDRLCTGNITFVKGWTAPLINQAGELDFEHMEKPQSVHLSRAAYPHWQGRNLHSQEV